MRIVQILVGPNDSIWQGRLLGLSAGGDLYTIVGNKWALVVECVENGGGI